MKTAVVILNWNTAELLRKFLPGLVRSVEGRDACVIVADNASTDASLQVLRDEFPSVRVIALDSNYGFTGGYNRALAQVDAQYYILLNSDVEVRVGWLDPLEEWMDSHPECGACGPKLLSWYDRDRFEYAGAAGGFIDRFGFPYCRGRVMGRLEKDRGQYDTPLQVLWCTGACMMVRSAVWKEFGGLDERFFAHMEEIDLCWRMALGGWQVWNVPQSAVYHMGGGTLPQTSPRKLFLNYRNSLLMLGNCLPGTIGLFRASIRISVRRVLDRCAQLSYLLTGKKDYARAVGDAHREWKTLSRKSAGGYRRISGYKSGHLLVVERLLASFRG